MRRGWLLCTDILAEIGGVGGDFFTAYWSRSNACCRAWRATDTQQEVLDECVQRIYGGTNEIMKELISRAL